MNCLKIYEILQGKILTIKSFSQKQERKENDI